MVSGMASGNKLQGAFTTGTLFALFQGVFFVVGPNISPIMLWHLSAIS